MSGRLKKGGLDRSTIAVERALQGIGALEVVWRSSRNGGLQRFNSDVEIDCYSGVPELDPVDDSNTGTTETVLLQRGTTIVARTQKRPCK